MQVSVRLQLTRIYAYVRIFRGLACISAAQIKTRSVRTAWYLRPVTLLFLDGWSLECSNLPSDAAVVVAAA